MRLFLIFTVLLIEATNGWRLPIDDYQYEHPKCPENELYKENVTACETTCENPNMDACINESRVTGCQCEEGFLRRADKKCVKPIGCDIAVVVWVCNKNETYKPYGTGCEATCDNAEPTNCNWRCQCKHGFSRNSENQCVHPTECNITTTPAPTTPTPTCPENEFLNNCHRPCEHECPVFREDGPSDNSWCYNTRCENACSCKGGLVRNYEGRCVKEAECPPPGHECKQNETFRICGPDCEGSCRRPNVVPIDYAELPCSPLKCKNGCLCKQGYIKNYQGECVKEEDCPYEDPRDKCKSVNCGNGNRCLIQEGRPVCIPGDELCWSIPCPPGYKCEAYHNRPTCVEKTCAGVICPQDEKCAMVKPLSCSNKTNCPLEPMCIYRNECDATVCPEKTKCVLQEEKCTKKMKNIMYYTACHAKCEPLECQQNEKFSFNKSMCSDTMCNNDPLNDAECQLHTERGCVCQEGFFRSRYGDCVTQKKCDKQKEDIKRFLILSNY